MRNYLTLAQCSAISHSCTKGRNISDELEGSFITIVTFSQYMQEGLEGQTPMTSPTYTAPVDCS